MNIKSIKSIKLITLNYSMQILEPSNDGSIYLGLYGNTINEIKKIDKGTYYVETVFHLILSNDKFDKNKEYDLNKYNGMKVTYGVYIDSLETIKELTLRDKGLILKSVEPYFNQKVNSLFAESNRKTPPIPLNFWKNTIGD